MTNIPTIGRNIERKQLTWVIRNIPLPRDEAIGFTIHVPFSFRKAPEREINRNTLKPADKQNILITNYTNGNLISRGRMNYQWKDINGITKLIKR